MHCDAPNLTGEKVGGGVGGVRTSLDAGIQDLKCPYDSPVTFSTSMEVHRIQKADTTVSSPFNNKSFAIYEAI